MNECSLCLAGNMEHTRTDLCRRTHMNWKNCGVECCVVEDDEMTWLWEEPA